jgi:hypothetical protein
MDLSWSSPSLLPFTFKNCRYYSYSRLIHVDHAPITLFRYGHIRSIYIYHH